MHHWDLHGNAPWGFAMMTVSIVLFWALIILAIVALVRYLGRSGRIARGAVSAEELLAQRFVRGEIDDDEYRRRLSTLSRRGRRW